jgi:hypothetical protein
MFAYEPEDCDKTSELKQAEHRSKQTLTRYVRDMVNDGVLDGDPELIAHAWWATMHGLIVLRMSGKLEDSPPFDLLRQAAARMIMRGVRTGGGAASQQPAAPKYGASIIR